MQKAAFHIIKGHELKGVDKPVENRVENTCIVNSNEEAYRRHVDFNTFITEK